MGIQRFYAFQAPLYDLTRWMFLFYRKKMLLRTPLKEGATVADIGCGTGYNFTILHEKVGEGGKIWGLDISSHMISRAHRKIRRHQWNNISIIQERAVDFSPEELLDAVFFSYSLTMITGWEETIDHYLHTLKPGGFIGIVDFLPHQKTLPFAGEFLRRWFQFCNVSVARNIEAYVEKRTVCHERGALWGYCFYFIGRLQAQ